MINMIRDFFFNINYINIQIRYPLVALLWVSECQRSNKISTSSLTFGFRMSKIKSAKSALPSSKNKLENKIKTICLEIMTNEEKLKS